MVLITGLVVVQDRFQTECGSGGSPGVKADRQFKEAQVMLKKN